jgi:hypothetical protein
MVQVDVLLAYHDPAMRAWCVSEHLLTKVSVH